MVLRLCTSYYCALHMYEVSWKYLKRFLRYRADTCMEEMTIFNIQRAITLKVGKQELRFMCSACHLMVFNICVKFHENISSGFKVMERAQKLLTDTHTHTKDENYIPHCIAYFVCWGYSQSYGSCVLHVVSWFNICVKFHENISSSFKLTEQTQKLFIHKG